MMSLEEIKRSLTFNYPFPDAQFESLISKSLEMKFKARMPIIRSGDVDENLYLVKDGLIRGVYSDNGKEKTFYFAFPGDLIASPTCLFRKQPAVITLESFTDSIVLAIPKAEFMQIVATSPEFALWLVDLFFGQLHALERKTTILCGDAYEKYDVLIKTRPELIMQAPVKVIASYLGITETSLSRLRNPKYRSQKKEGEK